jgi:tetratricopeptide (TPR) repeat protein
MKAIASLVTLLLLVAVPAQGQDAREYFFLGIRSSMTPQKVRYFSKALEIDPYFADAYEQRGLLYYFQEKYDRMIRDFENYLDLAPAKAEVYRMLGLGYLKSGFLEQAIVNFTCAIEMEPELTAAYANRAEAFRHAGEDEKALGDATRAIQLAGDQRSEADAYRTRARIYRKMGRGDQAVADTREAYWVDPRMWHLTERGKSWSTEDFRVIGLINIIAIAFVLLVVRLRPPGGR